ELKPGAVISGRVLDAATNEPLGPYASIIETVDNDTAAYYYTLTDKDGFFSYPLVGTGHVIKVDFTGYKSVKLPLDKNYFEIKLEKAPPGYKKDGVLYQFGVFHMGDAKSFDEEMKQMIGPNIRVVKPEELIDDGEGIFIEEIE
ncbi:MAG: carboxypeptidase regulatory-like domain-containing protein, partial [Bacteroidaceae bacterium]|nr:carboxypeptidase regulatory-like domain-containing protein [Bacteroidaceae bacterium]